MARKNAIVSITRNAENGELTFTVADTGEFNLNPAELSDEVRNRAMLHGLVQKVSDAAAMGKDATPSDKFAAMKSVADRLIEGEWSKRTGEGSGNVAGIIYRAFREFVETSAKAAKKPVPAEEAIRAVYDAKDRAGQLALRTVPAITTIIERMKAEKGSTGPAVDADSLLADLGL